MQYKLTRSFLDEAAELHPLTPVLRTFLSVVPSRPVLTTAVPVFFNALSVRLPIKTTLLKLPAVKRNEG